MTIKARALQLTPMAFVVLGLLVLVVGMGMLREGKELWLALDISRRLTATDTYVLPLLGEHAVRLVLSVAPNCLVVGTAAFLLSERTRSDISLMLRKVDSTSAPAVESAIKRLQLTLAGIAAFVAISTLMQNVQSNRSRLSAELRQRFEALQAIDDKTGLSAIKCLRSLPIDEQQCEMCAYMEKRSKSPSDTEADPKVVAKRGQVVLCTNFLEEALFYRQQRYISESEFLYKWSGIVELVATQLGHHWRHSVAFRTSLQGNSPLVARLYRE